MKTFKNNSLNTTQKIKLLFNLTLKLTLLGLNVGLYCMLNLM